MTFFEHLNVLRRHLWFSVAVLLIGFGVSMLLYRILIAILSGPLTAASANTGEGLYLTTVYESFLTRIKISLIAGLVMTLPVHIFNFLVFIFPALTSREKRIALTTIFAGFILIVLSLYYGYSFLVPFSIEFLTGRRFIVEGTYYLLGFTKNIFYIVQFFAALIIIFQLPLLMVLLISLKLITLQSAFKSGRHVIVGAFVLSAVLTPPDIVSQIMTALPMILLYYFGLLTAKVFRLGE